MHDYQKHFIEFCLAKNVLRFGEFTLKSGRLSPYFFNAGAFNSGEDLAILGGFYAAAIEESKIKFDILFGPAYKGIPLVCASAIAMASNFEKNYPYAFNRKEKKDHGEGGDIVGADINNKKILLIDDVITAGTAIRESVAVLQTHHASLTGVVIAINRQERGTGAVSAIQEVEQLYKIPVISIITLDNIIEYLQADKKYHSHLEKIQGYRKEFGV